MNQPPSSVRERLRARERPTIRFPLRMADTGDADRDLADAQAELSLALIRHEPDDPRIAAARDRVAAAQAAVDGCYEMLTIRGLPPARYEELVSAHPPTAEQLEKEPDAQWDAETFRAALLAACVEGDMGEDDWAEWLSDGPCNLAERDYLFLSALAVNTRLPEASVPKDLRPTDS